MLFHCFNKVNRKFKISIKKLNGFCVIFFRKMNRLVDYESTTSEDDSYSSKEDELNEDLKIERAVKATINYLLTETSKMDGCNVIRSQFLFDRKGFRDMIADNASEFSSATDDSDDSSSTSSDDDGEGTASDDSDCIYSKFVCCPAD